MARVAPELDARGIDVRPDIARFVRLPRPDPVDLATAAGWSPGRIVPGLLRLYPEARWAVALPNRREERRWLDRLSGAGLPHRVVDFRGLNAHWLCEPRVFVTSLAKLDACQPEDFDAAVVRDVGPLLALRPAPPGRGATTRCGDTRVPAFGFVPPDVKQSKGERRRLTAYFGIELPLPAPARPPSVWCACPRRGRP